MAATAALGQRAKSLRSSPLRGSKSREAADRENSDAEVNTISACIVANSKDHLRAH
jgi:hypothetical protein